MADIYVSSAGSNTAPYDTWEKATTDPQTGVTASVPGDTIWFEDEAWVFAFGLSFTALAAGDYLLRSRSDNPLLCSFSGASATLGIFGMANMVNVANVTVQGITLTREVTFTGVGGYAVTWVSGADATLTCQNVRFANMTLVTSINASTTGALIRTSAAVVSRTTSLIDCEFDALSISAISCGSVFSGHNNNHLVVTRPKITNIEVNITGVHYGMFYCNTGDITVIDPEVNGVALNGVAGSTNAMNGIFTQGGVGTLTITNPNRKEVQNIVSVGHQPHSLFARANAAYDVSGIIVHDCSMSQHQNDSLGLALLAYGTASSGTYSDAEVYDCAGHNGTAFYHSQGASAVVNRLKAYNNTGVLSVGGVYSAAGGLYSGGWGDLTLNDSDIHGNQAGEGGGVYLHLHGALATRNKTVTINNSTIVDNVSTSDGTSVSPEHGVMAKSFNETYTLTVNINNTIIDDTPVNTVYISGDAATAGVTVNCDHTYLVAPVTINPAVTTGAINITNAQESDPLLTVNYRVGTNSPAKHAGKYIASCLRDVRGRRRLMPPTIGAYDLTSGDPADTREVRT